MVERKNMQLSLSTVFALCLSFSECGPKRQLGDGEFRNWPPHGFLKVNFHGAYMPANRELSKGILLTDYYCTIKRDDWDRPYGFALEANEPIKVEGEESGESTEEDEEQIEHCNWPKSIKGEDNNELLPGDTHEFKVENPTIEVARDLEGRLLGLLHNYHDEIRAGNYDKTKGGQRIEIIIDHLALVRKYTEILVPENDDEFKFVNVLRENKKRKLKQEGEEKKEERKEERKEDQKKLKVENAEITTAMKEERIYAAKIVQAQIVRLVRARDQIVAWKDNHPPSSGAQDEIIEWITTHPPSLGSQVRLYSDTLDETDQNNYKAALKYPQGAISFANYIAALSELYVSKVGTRDIKADTALNRLDDFLVDYLWPLVERLEST